MTKLKKQSFLKGALIVAVANMIVKIIGALFKIPLTRFILGADGIAVYNASYTIYNVLFMVATAGLPVAISKMVSESAARQNYAEVRRIFSVANKLLLTVGLIGSAVLFFGSRFFAQRLGIPTAATAMLALSPCLFFVAVMSVYRGLFQGMSNMVPTAVSEMIEACGKLFIGLILSYLLLPVGKDMAAAGAILGVSTGAFLGAVYLVGYYRKTNKMLKMQAKENTLPLTPNRQLLSRLLRLAVPITLGSAVFTLASLIDLTMILNQLAGLGFDEATRKEMYGYYSGYAVPMFNLPPTVITALSISIVPAITGAIAAKRRELAKHTVETAIRITLLFALPCAVGMSVLAAPVLQFVYNDINAAGMLTVLSYGIIFVSLVMVTNSIIQATGKVWMPVVNMLIGGAVKVIVNFILVGNIDININGAPYGTVLCYITTALLNLAVIQKSMRPNYGLVFLLKTLVCTAAMGFATLKVYGWVSIYTGNTVALLSAVAAGALVYAALLLVLRTLKKQDVEAMPGSKTILKMIGRFL